MTSGLPKVTDRHQRRLKPGPGPLANPPCKKQRPFSRRTNQASESSHRPPSHHECPLRTWPVSIRDCCLESFRPVSCSGPNSATLVCARTSPPPTHTQCPVTSSTQPQSTSGSGSAASAQGPRALAPVQGILTRLLSHQARSEAV